MATFENTVTIQRPAEDVFAFLADFRNVAKWNYAIEETTKTSPGPVGVGTTYRQTRSVPRRGQERFEVTVFDPTRRLEIEGEIGPFQARIGYVLEPLGDATRLTNDMELEPSSTVSRLTAPLAASRVKAAVASNLNELKLILDGSEREGS
jgi:carbon monoxide dehydrogenase subunit G